MENKRRRGRKQDVLMEVLYGTDDKKSIGDIIKKDTI